MKELKLKALAAFKLDATNVSDLVFLKTGNENIDPSTIFCIHANVHTYVCMYVYMSQQVDRI